MGAFICLLTVIKHPDVVKSVVLEEPPVLTLFVSTPPRPTELAALFLQRPRTAAAIVAFGRGTLMPAQRAFSAGNDEAGMLAFVHGVLGATAYRTVPESGSST